MEVLMPVTKKKEPKAHDETPSAITDHAFEPRGDWYTVCKHCHLAEAAHAETTIDWRDHISYGDDMDDD